MPFQPQQPDRLGLGHPGLEAREQRGGRRRDVWHDGVLERGQLVDVVDHPQPVGRVDQELVRVLDEPAAAHERAQLVHDERRDLDP